MPNEGGFAGHPKKRIRVFWGPRSRPYKNHQRSAALRASLEVRLAHMRLPCPSGGGYFGARISSGRKRVSIIFEISMSPLIAPTIFCTSTMRFMPSR
jgi:hypothetical protein